MQLLLIVALVGQIEGDDQLVLGIDHRLRVVGHLMTMRRAHQLRLDLGRHHLLASERRQFPRLALKLRALRLERRDRKSTRLNSSHVEISYAVFCLKKKKKKYNEKYERKKKKEKRNQNIKIKRI